MNGVDDDDAESSIGEAVPLRPKHQGLFGSSGIQLDDDEKNHPVVIKFLRNINANQESEIIKLRSFEAQFYDKRQECEILKKEKDILQKDLDSKKQIETLQKLMIAVGSMILGVLKFMENVGFYPLIILTCVAVVLVLAGLFPVLQVGRSK